MFNNLYPEKRSFNARATIIINHVPERVCRTYLKPSFINHMEENTVLLILLQICPYVSYLINISNFIAQIQIWRVLSSYIPLVVFMRIPTPGHSSPAGSYDQIWFSTDAVRTVAPWVKLLITQWWIKDNIIMLYMYHLTMHGLSWNTYIEIVNLVMCV